MCGRATTLLTDGHFYDGNLAGADLATEGLEHVDSFNEFFFKKTFSFNELRVALNKRKSREYIWVRTGLGTGLEGPCPRPKIIK